MIAVGRVKVAYVRGGIPVRLVTQRPANLEGTLAGVSQLYAGRTGRPHGEITCEMNLLSVEAYIDWEGFDQILVIIPIVECAGPEEESDGRINGGTKQPIPDNPEPGVPEFRSAER